MIATECEGKTSPPHGHEPGRGCRECAPFAVIDSPGPWTWDVGWAVVRRVVRGSRRLGMEPSVRVLCREHWERETN